MSKIRKVRTDFYESMRTFSNLIFSLGLIICGCWSAAARDFFVSPAGRPNARGSINSPWDLQTALKQTSTIKPGDVLFLRDGTYNGAHTNGFDCILAGTSSAAITIRNYPGERAIIDRAGTDPTEQAALDLYGPYITVWGIEITNSYPDRNRISPYTGTIHSWRGPGIYVAPGATDCKIINCIIHDNNSGIYDKEDRTEIYGNLVYYNGNNGFAHGMYIGNNLDTKQVVDNLIFFNAGLGIQSYSADSKSQQKGIHIEGNISFNNGAITLDDQNSTNILVGAEAGVPAERVSLVSNYIYDSPEIATNKSKGIRLGQVDQNNRDALLRNNYIACKVPVTLQWWNYIEMQGNTIYTSLTSVNLKLASGQTTGRYAWDNNTYIEGRSGGPIFTVDSASGLNVSKWKQKTNVDGNSRVIRNASLRPRGVKIFVRANKYETGRGHIIIFNWDVNSWVSIDITSLRLEIGAAYEVKDAQNYFGPAVVRGLYDGKPITLPMDSLRVATPVGNVERFPTHTTPEFGAFVVQRSQTHETRRS